MQSQIIVAVNNMFTENLQDHFESYCVGYSPKHNSGEQTEYILDLSTLSESEYAEFISQLKNMPVEIVGLQE